MKKTLCIIAASMMTLAAAAQLQRGNVMVGSDIANVNITLNQGGNFSAVLNPKGAWFVQDNTALGGYLLFSLSDAKGIDPSIGYGVGLFGRYYINRSSQPLNGQTRLFFEGNAGLEGFNPDIGENTNGLGLGIGPGLAYFISPNVSLEGLAKYTAIVGFGSTPATSQINLGIGLQIYLTPAKVRSRVNQAE
jgi:hypothetical protein